MTAASRTSLMHSSFLLRIGEGGKEGFCTDGIPSSPFLAMSNLAMVRDRFGRRKVIGKVLFGGLVAGGEGRRGIWSFGGGGGEKVSGKEDEGENPLGRTRLAF